jgi:putative addiction module killer protein
MSFKDDNIIELRWDMEATPRKAINYRMRDGREPFNEWLLELKDIAAKVAIAKRIQRVELGNFGDCEPLAEGILELRIHVGPGYRVYLGQEGKMLVILLCGGKKRTQKEDIKLARKYWADYKIRIGKGA